VKAAEARDAAFLRNFILKNLVKPVQPGRQPTADELKKIEQLKPSMGGGDTGGGSVVACFGKDNAIKSVEVYDLYEGARRFHLQPDFGNATTTEEALSVFLSRLYLVNPLYAQEIQDRLNLFSANSEVLTDSNPPPASDLNPIIVPGDDTGCKVISTILQKEVHYPGEKNFYINGRIWNALSPLQKAAMMTHEVFLQHARSGHEIKDSTGIRFGNTQIWANGLQEAKDKEIKFFNDSVDEPIDSIVWHGMIVDYWGRVYSGQLQFYFGSKEIFLQPVHVNFMDGLSREKLASPIVEQATVYEFNPQKICNSESCIDKVQAIQIDDQLRVVNTYIQDPNSEGTADLYMLALDENGKLESTWQVTIFGLGPYINWTFLYPKLSKAPKGLLTDTLKSFLLATKKESDRSGGFLNLRSFGSWLVELKDSFACLQVIKGSSARVILSSKVKGTGTVYENILGTWKVTSTIPNYDAGKYCIPSNF
jgi:hypothetical protein